MRKIKDALKNEELSSNMYVYIYTYALKYKQDKVSWQGNVPIAVSLLSSRLVVSEVLEPCPEENLTKKLSKPRFYHGLEVKEGTCRLE